MEEAVEKVLEIVRTWREPQRAWAEIMSLCRESEPDGLWDDLPVPDIEQDVQAALEWLST